MKEQAYTRIGETLYVGTLENGLPIYLDQKRGFGKCFAFFATNYGGMDTRFKLDGVWQDTPEGVAHFLEHKLFDTEDGNALQDMAAAGASPNAFTSSAITGYFFECTERFEENLRTLLSFVSVPWFTPESVAKEQGIIGQEIRMGDDEAEMQVFLNVLDGLYHHHPIRRHVAGSVESIAEITDQTLYACHKAFYHPSNMVLCVAGDLDPKRIFDIAAELLPAAPGEMAEKDYGEPEPDTAVKAEIEVQMEVSTPLFQVGFKADPEPEGEGRLRSQLLGELACEALLGTSTALYSELYTKGLVNQNYGYGYENYSGCAFLCAGGESKDPRAVRDAILAQAERLAQDGVDEAMWNRLKKAAYGNKVRGLNSFENICVSLAQGHFAGYNYLRFPEVFDSITKTDVEQAVKRWFTPERASLSIVSPKEESK